MKYLWPIDEAFDDSFSVEAACHGEKKLARAYVPMQRFENIYEPHEALRRGTIFKDLDLPMSRKRP